MMPLSEHEQHLLEQLEQQLHAEDPKFANSLGTERVRKLSTRHIILGVLLSVVGLLCLLFGISIHQIVIGVIGFLVMGAGVYVATVRRGKRKVPSSKDGSQVKEKKSTFMTNLEQRWDERHREN